jgi:2-keto-4-pentenoate hydratase/2-oxohepta-3-ene-1,7-dioic acid hydratase in catechol pathway
MKLIRFQLGDRVGYGLIEGETVKAVDGDPFGEHHVGAAVGRRDEVRLLPPVQPTKIVCVGRNYSAHAAEMKADVPKEPLLFLKPPSSLIGPDETIILPTLSSRVEHEAELAVVIGRRARQVRADEAMSYVFGYTAANDVTARDLQRGDPQWTRGKGFDTFCPVGPIIETEFDPSAVTVYGRVNDEVRQEGNTRDFIFSIPFLLEYITQVMTLEPGDLLLTGTPSGVGPLNAGDMVEVVIEGIGVLRNPVGAA